MRAHNVALPNRPLVFGDNVSCRYADSVAPSLIGEAHSSCLGALFTRHPSWSVIESPPTLCLVSISHFYRSLSESEQPSGPPLLPTQPTGACL